MIIHFLYRVRIPLVLALGAFDAWAGRGSIMTGDTIGYMDMANAIADGDLGKAVNGYWSPLYPLLLSLPFRPFVDDPAGQFVVARSVNFLIFLLTVGAFEILLRHLAARRLSLSTCAPPGWSFLPQQHFVVAAYAAFVWACFSLNIVARLSPDNWVLAMLLFDVSVLLSLESATAKPRRYILFGFMLGMGYWVKAILFPIGLIILGVAVCHPALRGRKKMLWLSAATLGVVAAPLVILESIHCDRFTFGETGRLNYAWYVNKVHNAFHWQGGEPGQGVPVHPTRLIHENPAIYEFATPFATTYPPWTDPSYWYQGVKVRFELSRQIIVIAKNSFLLAKYLILRTYLMPVLAIILIFTYWKMKSPAAWTKVGRATSPVWIISLLYIVVYVAVYIDERHVAGSLLLLSLCMIMLVATRGEKWADRVVYLLIVASAAGAAPRLVDAAYHVISQGGSVRDWRWAVADEIRRIGLPPRTPVGLIGTPGDSDWAYTAQVLIVAEVGYVPGTFQTDKDAFWALDEAGRQSVLDIFRRVGAKLVVASSLPPNCDTQGWTQIPNTKLYYYELE